MNYTLPVTVITPVFNEEEIIESSVAINLELLRQSNLDFEILIIDDGSKDRSAKIIDDCFASVPEIKVIHKSQNGGIGSAMKLGIAHAQKDFILCVPADSPLTEEILSAFISASDKADIIVSYRTERKGYSLRMKFNSVVFQILVRNIFGIQLRDFNWIHMYHRKIFSENGIQITSKGVFMLAEVLIAAKRKGVSIFEIPVKSSQRFTGVATAAKWSTVFKTLKEMKAYYFNHV